MNIIMKDQADKMWLQPAIVVLPKPKAPRIMPLLISAYQALKTATIATTPAQQVRKMHGFILTVCVLGLFVLTVLASINTALSSPLVNISHYALVDQNGEE